MEINLTNEESELLNEIYYSHGYSKCVADVLEILEQKMGQVSSITIEVRKKLYTNLYELNDKCNTDENNNSLILKLGKRINKN